MNSVDFELFNKNIESQLKFKNWEGWKNINLNYLDAFLETCIDAYASDNHVSDEDRQFLYKIHQETFESVKKSYPLLKMQNNLSADDITKFIAEYKNKFKEFHDDELLILNAGDKLKIR